MILEAAMNSVEDRLDIMDVCVRLAWYVDLRQWAALAGVLTEKVRLDYTSLNGGDPVVITAAEVADAWSGLLGNLAATQHLMGSFLVELAGDTAVCTAMFQATHRLPNDLGDPHWTLGGRYRFDVVRAGAQWKISGIVMTRLWSAGNRHVIVLSEEAQTPRRDGDEST
jgi:hypothetical protein